MSDNNNFTIKDNSQIISILPKEWIEPLIIISKIKGYDGIDEYVLEMIRDRLEMFIDTRDELGDDFKKYMENIEGLEGLSDIETTTSTETAENKNAKQFVKDVFDNNLKKSEDKEDKEDLR